MQSSSRRKFDLLSGIFILFVVIGLFGQGFLVKYVSLHSPLYRLSVVSTALGVGCYWFSMGIKRLRQRQIQQPQARWYTQPSILLGLGALFALPYEISALFIDYTALDAMPLPLFLPLFFGPSILCVVAMIFFWFYNFSSPHKKAGRSPESATPAEMGEE